VTTMVLPRPLQSILNAATRALLDPGDRSSVDFSRPTGEAALVSPDSVSWRVFKNPLSLFIGGVTAVVMELAEPRVRTGVRAAIDLTPRWLRTILGLNEQELHPWEAEVVRRAGAFVDRLVLESNPAVQACRRIRLPADYLYS
jgi:uncharacterized protein (DUF2236 family)